MTVVIGVGAAGNGVGAGIFGLVAIVVFGLNLGVGVTGLVGKFTLGVVIVDAGVVTGLGVGVIGLVGKLVLSNISFIALRVCTPAMPSTFNP